MAMQHVLADLTLGLGKLRVGGLLLGDDYHLDSLEEALTSRAPRAVAAAVEDFAEIHAACVDVVGLCNYQYVLLKVC